MSRSIPSCLPSTWVGPSPLTRPASLALAVAAACASWASAQVVVEGLDGRVHPADLGWTYVLVGNSVPGTTAFTVERGGILAQHTLGIGYSGQGGNAYSKDVVVASPSSWIMEARVRVLASEIWSFPFGSYVAFGNTGAGFQVDLLSPLAGGWTTWSFDTTVWRTYRWEVTSCGRWTLFIDGEYFYEGLGAQTSGTLALTFGDGTGGANADAELDFLWVSVNLGIGADFDGDGDVDGADLGTLLASWDQPGITDLTCDGTTDGADLGALLSLWGDGG